MFAFGLITDFRGQLFEGALDRGRDRAQEAHVAGAPVVDWHDYPMEHSVSPQEIADMAVFLPPIGKSGKPVWQFWQGLDRKKYSSAAGIAVVALDMTPPQVIEFLSKTQESLKSEGEAAPATGPFAMLITPAAAETILGP